MQLSSHTHSQLKPLFLIRNSLLFIFTGDILHLNSGFYNNHSYFADGDADSGKRSLPCLLCLHLHSFLCLLYVLFSFLFTRSPYPEFHISMLADSIVFFFSFFIEEQLIHSVVLILGVQQSRSVFLQILFHYSLTQASVYSSLCYTVNPCCLSILCIIVYIC